MESLSKEITEQAITTRELHSTTPPDGQLYCGYVYLLDPEPKNGMYGIIKPLCFGNSQKEVDGIVQAMLDSGQLEPHLPRIRNRPVGKWQYIVAGNDPKAEQAAYNTETQEYVTGAESQLTQKRKESAKQMHRKMKQLQQEAKDITEDDPESYEVYAHNRVREMSVSSWLKEQKRVIAEQEKSLVKANKKRVNLERKYPKYKLQFNKEMTGNVVEEESEKTTSSNEKGKEEETE